MKKIFTSILVIYIFFFFLEFCFNYFKKSHIEEYKINDIIIKEDYKGNTKNEENNYYFEIKTNKNIFYIQTFTDYKKEKKIIKDIKYFENDKYECILPIFKTNKLETDLICIENNTQKNYNTFENNEIDNFLSNIAEYNKENYNDNLETKIIKGFSTFYVNNLPENNYLALTYYKGIKIADKTSFREIELFTKDEYNQKIKTFYKDKYLVIDYNKKYESNEFILIDLKTRKKDIIGSNHIINYDAYIQGKVDNSIYLFDKDTKSQYQIDIKDKTIIRIGNENAGIKYYDGSWQNKTVYEAIKEELTFKEYDKNNEYVMIKKLRGENNGYTIYVKENNGKYDVYISYRNTSKLIYLLTTTEYQTLNFFKDEIYYKDGIYLKMYSNKTGNKTIIRDTELKNKSITFYVGENIW
mgnify:CR=1 FL=1